MTGFVITPKGMEDVCAAELVELVGGEPAAEDSIVLYTSKNPFDECIVTYRSQSAIRSGHLLFKFPVLESIEATISGIGRALKCCDAAEWLTGSYKVETVRMGEHDFTSPEFSALTGAVFHEAFPSIATKMEGFDTLLLVFINGNQGYCGIDLGGFDLAKRDYRIFHSTQAFKSPIAYAAVRLSEPPAGCLLLDPFTGAGTVAIEAAYAASGRSVNYYRKEELLFRRIACFADQPVKDSEGEPRFNIVSADSLMRNISAAKKNSKIAGVQKMIRFSRMDLEWLDVKFEKGSAARIVTLLPSASRLLGEGQVKKIHAEFFHQADYLLAKQGTLTLLAMSLPQNTGAFHIFEQRELWSGQQKILLLRLRR